MSNDLYWKTIEEIRSILAEVNVDPPEGLWDRHPSFEIVGKQMLQERGSFPELPEIEVTLAITVKYKGGGYTAEFKRTFDKPYHDHRWEEEEYERMKSIDPDYTREEYSAHYEEVRFDLQHYYPEFLPREWEERYADLTTATSGLLNTIESHEFETVEMRLIDDPAKKPLTTLQQFWPQRQLPEISMKRRIKETLNLISRMLLK